MRRKLLWSLVVLVAIVCVGALNAKRVMRWMWGNSANANWNRVDSGSTIEFPFDGRLVDGLPEPWNLKVIVGKDQVSVSDAEALIGQKVLHLRAESAHYLLWNPSKQFDPKKFPILAWSWKAIILPTRGDVRTHSALPLVGDNRNDKAAQILVGFEGDKVLMYVWDTTAPVGTEVEEWSPVAQVMTQVIESGPLHVGQWQDYRVNIYDDYVRRYGSPPTKVIGVSVQINSNHTGSVSEAMIGKIRAESR